MKTTHLLGLQDPFSHLVNTVRDYAIFLLDAGGRVASWNPGAERIKGYAAAEILGEHFSIFYSPEAKARRWPEQELKIAAEQGRLEDEGWRVAKGGRQFWANVVITALRDDRGELRGFSKITRDLTERRQREELLRRSEERFRLLVEGVRDYAIFMLDREGHVTSWNAGAERMKGYSPQEILGQHFSVFYPKDALDKKWPEQELAMAREHGRFEDEGVRLRKDGSRFWAHVVVTPLYDSRGELVGYAKVTRDLTDRKRVEALENAERRTNEFLAMLAHELRNPLAPVSNALQLLSRKPPSDPTEKWAREVLQRQTGQMVRLVNDLVDVSRITRSAISLERKPLDLRAAVRAAGDASRQWLETRRQVLSVDLGDEPLVVLADEARMVQVVQNLLHNASKYSAEDSRIEVTATREGGAVALSVKDNGMGMEPELLHGAFELFRQGPRALDRAEGGLGIGLTLVQRLVAMHGGTVEARSAGPGTGSEFIVRLPLADREALTSTAPESTAQPRPRRSCRVLVVDDNQDAANALRLLLEDDGHRVMVASDGVAGLTLARDHKPDYLLLDIGLPRLTGYDIAATVRGDPAMNDVTLVAITGYGQTHDFARTAAVGFDYHLTKPVDYRALQELLEK